jgi:hypothetical protein
MSSKNKLQEFFQKRGLPLPIYYSNRVGGTDNDPKWVCVIKLHNGETVYSDPCSSKKACEAESAYKALSEIDSRKLKFNIKYSFDIDSDVTILVDGENLPTVPIKFVTEVDASVSFQVYISKDHPIKPKLNEHDITAIEVDSTRKDAVDIAIVRDSAKTYSDHIIIVTNDHFGSTLVELINKEGTQPIGHFARNYEGLLNILQSISKS